MAALRRLALKQAKQEAARTRLDGIALPRGAGWITAAREAALARLIEMGLPGRRDEYWKFTRPDTLTQAEAPKAAVFAHEQRPVFDGMDRLRIVFVDGVFDAQASDPLDLAGVEIERLETAAGADIHWAGELYGALEIRGQDPVERPLAALNTALASDGVLIRVTARATRPVNLIYRHKSESSDVLLHHVIKLEKGADLTLLENGPAAARLNTVMEVEIADGAARRGATMNAARRPISLPARVLNRRSRASPSRSTACSRATNAWSSCAAMMH